MRGYHLDPDARVADEHFAIVYAPRRLPASCPSPQSVVGLPRGGSHIPVQRRARDRVPEASVQIVESELAARDGADPARHLFPARVIGPARSSEGMRLFYIERWLDDES